MSETGSGHRAGGADLVAGRIRQGRSRGSICVYRTTRVRDRRCSDASATIALRLAPIRPPRRHVKAVFGESSLLRKEPQYPTKGYAFFVCVDRAARAPRARAPRARAAQRSFTSITRQQPRATPTAPSAPCAAHIYPERYTHTRALAPRDTHTHTHTGRRAAAGDTLSRLGGWTGMRTRSDKTQHIIFSSKDEHTRHE